MSIMSKKTNEELKKLRVSKIGGHWSQLVSFSMTLNDGSTCKGGPYYDCSKFFDFDEKSHICKIDIIMQKNE